MKTRNIIVALFVAAVFVLPSVALACDPKPPKACPTVIETGKNWKNPKDLTVKIEYLYAQGHTVVNASGIYYYINGKGPSKGNIYYPAPYWYDAYPLYLMGGSMTFKITIKNTGRNAYKNMKIVAVQEYLDFFGKDGEDIAGMPPAIWDDVTIPGRGSWSATVTQTIPGGGQSGLDQTHVQIQQGYKLVGKCTKLTWDKPQAGLYCPPEE